MFPIGFDKDAKMKGWEVSIEKSMKSKFEMLQIGNEKTHYVETGDSSKGQIAR